jgi:hypothetical protein
MRFSKPYFSRGLNVERELLVLIYTLMVVRFLTEETERLLYQSLQTDSESLLISHSVRTRGSFLGVKVPGL